MLEAVVQALKAGQHLEVLKLVNQIRTKGMQLEFRANDWQLPFVAAKTGGEGGKAVLKLWLEQERASTGVVNIPTLVQQLIAGMGLDNDGMANVKTVGRQLQEQEQLAAMQKAGITVSKEELFKEDDAVQFEKQLHIAVKKGFDLQILAPDAVRFNAVKIVKFMCEGSKTLSDHMLECFKECFASRNMYIASVILQAYPGDDRLKQAMHEKPYDSRVLRVMKTWTLNSSREYAAIVPLFEQHAKTYLQSLPGLLALGLSEIYDSLVSVLPISVAGSTTPLPVAPNSIGLPPDETKLTLYESKMATECSNNISHGKITQFNTQPAKFMECFIEAAVLQTLQQQIANAKASMGMHSH